MKAINPITSLPPSPTDDRHSRMVKYVVAMGIRVVCIVLCFVVPLGWWTLLPILGAVLIPYYAVVLANVGHEQGGAVESPGGQLEAYRGPAVASPAPEPRFRPTVVGDDEGPVGAADDGGPARTPGAA
ncbi:DUF3099 domain-containing protein [Frigoribacterium salinisoli]